VRWVASSVNLRPIKRLTANKVRSGLVTACRRAIWPTRRPPSLVNATTDGVVRLPSSLGITSGSPCSMIDTQELVVPRSMPMAISAMSNPSSATACSFRPGAGIEDRARMQIAVGERARPTGGRCFPAALPAYRPGLSPTESEGEARQAPIDPARWLPDPALC
jgi:hypothetical protein